MASLWMQENRILNNRFVKSAIFKHHFQFYYFTYCYLLFLHLTQLAISLLLYTLNETTQRRLRHPRRTSHLENANTLQRTFQIADKYHYYVAK